MEKVKIVPVVVDGLSRPIQGIAEYDIENGKLYVSFALAGSDKLHTSPNMLFVPSQNGNLELYETLKNKHATLLGQLKTELNLAEAMSNDGNPADALKILLEGIRSTISDYE